MLEVTIYLRPNGSKTTAEISNIYAEDEEFFKSYRLQVSMEELANDRKVVYCTTGRIDRDGEPEEVLYIVRGNMSCEDALQELALLVRERIGAASQP